MSGFSSGYSVAESARFGEVRMATDAGGEHWSAVDCPVPLGGALLIHERLLHSSTPNRTEDVRWSLDLRYCNALLPTGRAGTPGFVARSPSRPETVARSVEDWLALLDPSMFDAHGLNRNNAGTAELHAKLSDMEARARARAKRWAKL